MFYALDLTCFGLLNSIDNASGIVRTVFNITDWIRLKEESHIHLECFEGD